MKQPRKLTRGDRVAIVAPGGPIPRERLEAGVRLLRDTGLSPVYDDRVFAQDRYLAGPDADRLALLQAALDDPAIAAVWAARGGYGLTRLLPGLRLDEFAAGPKLVIGFSDVSALHAALAARGLGSFHGPNVGQLVELTPAARTRVLDGVFSSLPLAPLTGAERLIPGRAEGVLLGGNLTVLASLAGTPDLPSFAGAILVLEDVGERPYRLDRALTQLRASGMLRGLRGLALGAFTRCEDASRAYTAREVLASLARELGVPAAIGFPFGHQGENFALPLGATAHLDADEGTLSFLEGLA